MLDQYLYLGKGKTLVKGARHSLLIDFKSKKLYRVNELASQILGAAERHLRVSDVVAELSLEESDILSFVEDLLAKGLIQLSSTLTLKKCRPVKKPPPKLEFLWIETTSRCNLFCLHCYANAQTQCAADPSTEEIEKIIDEASALGCRKIQFTGGECTLRSDLRHLIDYAKAKGIEFVEIFTNGTLLSEAMVHFFASVGVHVAVSIYSYRAETHDEITGVEGSFEKTLNSIKLLLAYDVPTRAALIAMKKNEDDLDKTCYLLGELGVLGRPPDPIRPCGRGVNQSNWPDNYGKHVIQTQPNFKVKKQYFDSNRSWNSCWFGKAALTSDGDVLPCVFARDQVAGNIRERSLAEIITKDMIRFWCLTMDHVKTCRGCEYRYLCRDCRPWAYGVSGELDAKSSRCTYDPYTGVWDSA